MRQTITLLLSFLLILVMFSLIGVKHASASVSTAENSWAQMSPMFQARANAGVAVVDGKIYVMGGSSREGSSDRSFQNYRGVLGTTEVYDPESNTWTGKTGMTPMSDFSTVVCQGKIYCIDGGPVMQVYDPERNRWNRTAPKLVPRESTPMVFQDKVFIIGGATNEVYDFATDSWENKTSMPYPQEYAMASTVNGKFYFIGGRTNNTLNQVYDPITDYWEIKAPMPTAAFGGSLLVDNRIYVIGVTSGVYQYDWLTQIYDPETGRWSQAASPPSSTGFLQFVFATGEWAPKRIYLFNSVLQAYDPQTDSWALCATIPVRRIDMSFAVVNDRMYAIGGALYTMESIFATPISGSVSPSQGNQQFTPFGYGTIPKISVNPEKMSRNSVFLNFTTNRQVNWAVYSLDGQENVTVNGNTTLTELSNGLHNITVYANDTFGNMGSSETMTFTIPEPFPAVPIAVISAVSAAVIGTALIVYSKKHHH